MGGVAAHNGGEESLRCNSPRERILIMISAGLRKKRSKKRILIAAIIGVVLIYTIVSLVVAFPFSNILFLPHPGDVPSLTTRDAANVRNTWVRDDSVEVDTLTIASAAGPKPIRLSAWWIHQGKSDGKSSIVFLAGSGGLEPALFEDEIQLMTGDGFNCLLLDQRGYGSSQGELLSHGWFERDDFSAVVDTLAARYGIDRNRIGIWAISMGASNAVDIAAAHPEIHDMLLFAPWSTPQVMAANFVSRSYSIPTVLLQFPVWVAIRIGTMRNRGRILDPAEEATRVHARVLVVYGDQDDITNPALIERLYQSLAGKKDRVIISAAHHNDLIRTMGQPRYLETLRNFFAPMRAGSGSRP
jgi:pimeloyl-ACP methyl ester carboxylesterase